MSSNIPSLPDLVTEFEGPKVLKPGLSAIPFADRFYAWRTAMANAVLNRVIEAFGFIQGDAWKQPVRGVLVANDTLSGLAGRDGLTPTTTDRWLVTGQTTASQNGYYTPSAGAWTRCIDADTGAKVAGAMCLVTEGTYAGSTWALTTTGAITVGATNLAFSDVMSMSAVRGFTSLDLRVGAVNRIRALAGGTTEIDAGVGVGTGTPPLRIIRNTNSWSLYVLTGPPEGAVAAPVGAWAIDIANDILYTKRTGTGNTGWVKRDRAESGTWTPTATATLNLDAITPTAGIWSRVGDQVSFAIRVNIDPTATGGTGFRLSLPVVSNFTGNAQCHGIVAAANTTNSQVVSDATNDAISVTLTTSSTSAYDVWITGMYTVLP